MAICNPMNTDVSASGKIDAAPTVSLWFSENGYGENGGSILLQGSGKPVDRLLIKDNRRIIIDYKTGDKSSSDQQQVKAYIDILKNGLHRGGGVISLYLHDMDVVAVPEGALGRQSEG